MYVLGSSMSKRSIVADLSKKKKVTLARRVRCPMTCRRGWEKKKKKKVASWFVRLA